jgi:hypothetical protein
MRLTTPFAASPPGVEVAVHEDSAGPRVLFVVCNRLEPTVAQITLPERMSLVDAVSGERYEGSASVDIPVDGPGCRMLVCETSLERANKPRHPSARRSPSPC